MSIETSTDRAKNAPTQDELLELTSEVVSAYVGKNTVSTTDLPELIQTVYGKLSSLGSAQAEPEVEQKPAVPIKKSVTNQAIICLECGKRQKTLKRHLATAHGLTPDEYRAKWGLALTYPMVAPDYAEKRRTLAKEIGLGRKPAQVASKGKTGRTQPGAKGKTASKKAS